MTLEIRQATREDMFAILRLIKEGSSPENPTFPAFLGTPDTAKMISLVERKLKDGTIDVAIVENEVVGTIVASIEEVGLSKNRALACLFLYMRPSARHGRDGLEFVSALRPMSERFGLPIGITIHEHEKTPLHAAILDRLGFMKIAETYLLPLEVKANVGNL
jgi:hypothetical protein